MTPSVESRFRLPSFRTLVVLLFFALIGGFLLSSEHRAHALGVLPFLLLLALCPLLHLFMHGGHGRHGSSIADKDGSAVGPGEGGTAETHRH